MFTRKLRGRGRTGAIRGGVSFGGGIHTLSRDGGCAGTRAWSRWADARDGAAATVGVAGDGRRHPRVRTHRADADVDGVFEWRRKSERRDGDGDSPGESVAGADAEWR